MSAKYFHKQLELSILQLLGRVLVVVMAVYLILRFEDLLHRGILGQIVNPGAHAYERNLFLVEMGLLFGGFLLLCFKHVRTTAGGLYLSAVFVLLGFVTNRLNVSVHWACRSAGGRTIHSQMD